MTCFRSLFCLQIQLQAGFPGSSAGKESVWYAGDPGSIPGSQRSPGEGIGYALQNSWASLVAQMVKNRLQCKRPRFHSWVRKFPWRRDRLPTPVFKGFPGGSDGRESACNVEDLVSTPGLGRSSGGGHGYPLQYCCLENPMDRATWWATVHGVAKSQTRLSD